MSAKRGPARKPEPVAEVTAGAIVVKNTFGDHAVIVQGGDRPKRVIVRGAVCRCSPNGILVMTTAAGAFVAAFAAGHWLRVTPHAAESEAADG